MGYVRQKSTLRLRFEDPDMEGLVVEARIVPVGAMLELMQLGALDPEDIAAAATPENIGKVNTLLAGFAEALVSWNLQEEDDDGNVVDVPATAEGMHSQDLLFVLKIVMAWISTMSDVSTPLGQRSPSGKPSLVASLPMDPLSGSRAS